METSKKQITEVTVAKTQAHFFQLMRVRATVFMLEQMVDPMIEMDQEDDSAIHLIALVENQVVGTCRLVIHDTYVKIGRLAVLAPYRKKGIASALLSKIEYLDEIKDIGLLVLNAQVSALPLYIKTGYQAEGDHFYEANIEHVRMTKANRHDK
jgi:Predicted acyltransferase